jgi:hypothetical protein
MAATFSKVAVGSSRNLRLFDRDWLDQNVRFPHEIIETLRVDWITARIDIVLYPRGCGYWPIGWLFAGSDKVFVVARDPEKLRLPG